MHLITSARSMKFTYFLLQSFLILVLHFAAIIFSGAPGGSVGMVPFFAIYALAIQMGVLLFLYLIAGVLLNYRNKLMWIWTGALVFELAIIVVTGETSVMGIFQQGTDRLVNMSFLVPNILAAVITLVVATKLEK